MSYGKILNASFEIFAEHGYMGTSMSQIAEKVGITKAGIYSHFKSKQQLFSEVVRKEAESLHSILDEFVEVNLTIIENKSTKDLMYKYVKVIFDQITKDNLTKRLWSMLMFNPTPYFSNIIEDEMKQINMKLYDIQELIFKHGIKTNEIVDIGLENLIYTFSSFIEGNIGMLLYTNLFSYDKLNLSFDIFWKSIKQNQ